MWMLNRIKKKEDIFKKNHFYKSILLFPFLWDSMSISKHLRLEDFINLQ